MKLPSLPTLTPDHLIKGYIAIFVVSGISTGAQLGSTGPTFNAMVSAFIAGTALVGISNSRLMKLMRQQIDLMKDMRLTIDTQQQVIQQQQDLLRHIAGHDAPTAPDERRLN